MGLITFTAKGDASPSFMKISGESGPSFRQNSRSGIENPISLWITSIPTEQNKRNLIPGVTA